MIKVVDQVETGQCTVLFLNAAVPFVNFKKISIGGKEYFPEIVYDMDKSIAVKAKGNFTGEEVTFIK